MLPRISSFLTRTLIFVLLTNLALVAAGCSSSRAYHPQPSHQPYEEPPPPTYPHPRRLPTPPSPPPTEPCSVHFDPCVCKLSDFKIPLLDERLQYPGDVDATAANLRRAANDYKNAYWATRQQETGIFALRFYAGYLQLVPPRNDFAPFALLHSISLYCGLGCQDKAEDLARELRSTYTIDSNQIQNAFSYCR